MGDSSLSNTERPEGEKPGDENTLSLAGTRRALEFASTELSEVEIDRDSRIVIEAGLAIGKDLLERVLDYENRITWGTTCAGCARYLDASIAHHERAEKAEAEVEKLRALVVELRDVEAEDVRVMRAIRRQRGEAEAAVQRAHDLAMEWDRKDDDPIRSNDLLAALNGGYCKCGSAVSDRGAKYCSLCFPDDEAGEA